MILKLLALQLKNGNLENMKWLLKNNFEHNNRKFNMAILNGSVNNIKWLLENNFSYEKFILIYASISRNPNMRKWLSENITIHKSIIPFRNKSIIIMFPNIMFEHIQNLYLKIQYIKKLDDLLC
jgi:hypothetical protein